MANLEALDTETTSLQEERTSIERKMSIASKTEFKPIQINNRQEVDQRKS